MTTVTLKQACAEYLEHLKAIGKKPSTIGTARRTLDLLIAAMGEDKEVGNILPVHVSTFFKSEAATMQPGKDGLKPRAQASILQIRRIVRAALVWWHEQGHCTTLALPKSERRFLEPKEKQTKAMSKQDNAENEAVVDEPTIESEPDQQVETGTEA